MPKNCIRNLFQENSNSIKMCLIIINHVFNFMLLNCMC